MCSGHSRPLDIARHQCASDLLVAVIPAFRVFNLANTVPDTLADDVKLAVNEAVSHAAEALERSPNPGLVQRLLTVAGPPQYGLAGGWVHNTILTDANRQHVLAQVRE